MKRWCVLALSLAGCATAPRIAEPPVAAPQAETENVIVAPIEIVETKPLATPPKPAAAKPSRAPAAIPGSRFPANLDDSLPVLMICSGGANVPRVFSFSGESDKLRVFFGFKGGATVAGTAQISLRATSDTPVFEGEVPVTGTRTSDGRRYQLTGQVGKAHFAMDLVYNGTGTLYRTIDGEARERFEAHCQVEPRAGQ